MPSLLCTAVARWASGFTSLRGYRWRPAFFAKTNAEVFRRFLTAGPRHCGVGSAISLSRWRQHICGR
jgi:hypothetical protein